MRHMLFTVLATVAPMTGFAEQDPRVAHIVQDHILPRFETLADASDTLANSARAECTATSDALRAAYFAAFDAWGSASHLRFGPTEIENRAFALAFWPDSRGATPKGLRQIISARDPVAMSASDYQEVSIAARGFYALEYLLFDEGIRALGDETYRCTLTQTITADIAAMSHAIEDDWRTDYAAQLLSPSGDGHYRSDDEALQELLKALSAGLQFTGDMRIGRPLGSFTKPRPKRAEAWRSGRSARHVALSLQSLNELSRMLAGTDEGLSRKLGEEFTRASTQLTDLNDPVFASITEPRGRLRLEVVQQSVGRIRTLVREALGPALGVAAGFNSMDGD